MNQIYLLQEIGSQQSEFQEELILRPPKRHQEEMRGVEKVPSPLLVFIMKPLDQHLYPRVQVEEFVTFVPLVNCLSSVTRIKCLPGMDHLE